MAPNARSTENPSQLPGYRVGICAIMVLATACGGGDAGARDLGGATSAITNPSNNQRLSILHRCDMPSFGDGDHMSTNKHECPTGTEEGQTFYVPSAPEAGTHPLYRLYKASGLDHMDSTGTAEGGYTDEFTLGYPFNSPSQGTCELRRWYAPGINDHMTAFCGESPAGHGYNQESVLGYGYERHGKSGESLIAVTGSSVTLKANLVAGGAIAELWWGGKQFVNDRDFGRQIQTAVSLTSSGSSEADNPTEAGDKFGWPAGSDAASDASWAHGSPLLARSASGTTLSTTTAPLQWNPTDPVFGGDQDHPVRWRGTISKSVTLDFGSSNAIEYVTKIYFPMAETSARTEVVTAYLTPDFTKFYLYYADTDTFTDITNKCPAEGASSTGYTKLPGPQNGGIILATGDGAYALGGYHKNPGYTAYYQCGNFTNRPGSGKYGDATTKWSIFGEYPGTGAPMAVAAGTTRLYTNYLTVGTLDTARSEMRRLYLAGN